MMAWPRQPPLWLRAAEAVYRRSVTVHGFLYDCGILHSASAGVPVVSVGNLTVGGTGKTPCVIWLVRELVRGGERPVILTRGYGRRGRGLTVLAREDAVANDPRAVPGDRDPAGAARTPEETGDEPLEMFEALGVPIVIGRDRGAAARLATARFDPTCLVLDDGFQHRPLRRDFDLVLLDATPSPGNRHHLPAGPLRESGAALVRADAILVTRANEATNDFSFEWAGQMAPRAWIGRADHVAVGVEPLVSHTPHSGMKGDAGAPAARTPVLVVAGIARPASLARAAEGLGHEVAARLDFPDHHRYTPRDLARVVEVAAGRPILTTAKDAVRWRAVPGFDGAGWWVVRLEFRPRDPEALLERIRGAFSGARQSAAKS